MIEIKTIINPHQNWFDNVGAESISAQIDIKRVTPNKIIIKKIITRRGAPCGYPKCDAIQKTTTRRGGIHFHPIVVTNVQKRANMEFAPTVGGVG